MIIKSENEKAILEYIHRYYNEKRWIEVEHVIIKYPTEASHYAIYFIKGPWPEAEQTILKDIKAATNYSVLASKKPWPEIEPKIAKDVNLISAYLLKFPNRKKQIFKYTSEKIHNIINYKTTMSKMYGDKDYLDSSLNKNYLKKIDNHPIFGQNIAGPIQSKRAAEVYKFADSETKVVEILPRIRRKDKKIIWIVRTRKRGTAGSNKAVGVFENKEEMYKAVENLFKKRGSIQQ